MLSRTISVAIVDDHALFRKTLKNYLAEQHKIQVVFQASEVFEMFAKLKSASPDIIIMDIFMPQLNGNEAIKEQRNQYPSIKILVLSMSTDVELISDMLDAGIHGYISKGDDPEDLLQAIQSIGENRIYRNRHFTEALYRNKQNNIKTYTHGGAVILSEREKKILQLIWQEKSNKEMADELFLGVRSIEKIRQDLKEKVGVKSTVGLLKYALNRKLLEGQFQ